MLVPNYSNQVPVIVVNNQPNVAASYGTQNTVSPLPSEPKNYREINTTGSFYLHSYLLTHLLFFCSFPHFISQTMLLEEIFLQDIIFKYLWIQLLIQY